MGTFDEARASVCLAVRRWEGEQMEIDGDAVPCGEAEDANPIDFKASKLEGEEVKKEGVGIEGVGCRGREGGGGRRDEDFNCSNCRIDLNQSNGMIDGSDSSTPLPLSPPLLPPNKSSMPSILAVLHTHVHLNFPGLKFFHLIAAEEILNAYGIELTI